jgi:hypothetical protein
MRLLYPQWMPFDFVSITVIMQHVFNELQRPIFNHKIQG